MTLCWVGGCPGEVLGSVGTTAAKQVNGQREDNSQLEGRPKVRAFTRQPRLRQRAMNAWEGNLTLEVVWELVVFDCLCFVVCCFGGGRFF